MQKPLCDIRALQGEYKPFNTSRYSRTGFLSNKILHQALLLAGKQVLIRHVFIGYFALCQNMVNHLVF